nr:MAG TPA: hypothetical protein [Caudoviricetes sp.]
MDNEKLKEAKKELKCSFFYMRQQHCLCLV